MLCYLDMTFCTAPCTTEPCLTKLTEQVRADARQWAARSGLDGAPMSVEDMSHRCSSFQPKTEET